MKNLKYFSVLLMVISSFSLWGQWQIEEGFESGTIPAEWTIYDVNNDGSQWRAYENSDKAHSGDWSAFVDCYTSDGEDWLVTPAVTVQAGDSFIFYARSWASTEDFNVKLSTSGNAISNFNHTLESVTGVGNDYVEYSYDLGSYAGTTIYLAIEWLQDTYGMLIDDVKVGQPQANDVGMLSLENPAAHEFLNAEIYPAGTIQNYGTSEVSESFDITCIITNSQSTVVYSSIYTFSGTLAAAATESITFTDAWIPAEIGDYETTMTTQLTGDANPNNDTISDDTEVVEHYGTGGPDDFGYHWIDSTEEGGPVYDWIEISETGTSTITYGVPSFSGDDNFSEPIAFGFDFPFYGIDRSYFIVDVNGEFLLTTDNPWYNAYPSNGWSEDGNVFNYVYPIPGYEAMPALVAVFWDDLEADAGTGDIYFQTFGTAPDRYCVVEWHNVRFHAGTGGDPTLCFEVIFHENGDMIFQYQNVANGQTGSTCPHDFGQSATIAIQNDTTDIGLCYLREIVDNGQYIGVEPYGNLPQNELAIRFYTGEDNSAPNFVHDEIGNTFEHEPQLSVAISDMSEIVSDTLYYNIGSGWEGIAHTSFAEPNIYYYQLPELAASTTVQYYFVATDGSANQNRGTLPANAPTAVYSFRILPTEGVDVLFAYPGNQDWELLEYPVYIQALDDANVNYDIYNWYEYDDYRFPSDYKIIITYANSSSASAKHDTLSVALMEFMDSGTEADPKNVFMASDGLAYSQNGFPNDKPLKKFYTAYLRGGYYGQGTYGQPPFGGTNGLSGPNVISYENGSVIGVSGSPIGEAGVEFPVYANSPDVIYPRECPDWYADEVTNPDISSEATFLFEDGPGPLVAGQAYCYHGVCAIWLDNLIYKSFFTSFDLSQFTDTSDIDMIIGDALEWFQVQVLNPPQNLSVTELGYATWEAPAASELLGYNVYLDDVLIEFTTDLSYQYSDLMNGQTYDAGVKAVYDEGSSIMINYEFTYEGMGSQDIPVLITTLHDNYPNPFNPETTISFATTNSHESTRIEVYNLKGQKVKMLVNEILPTGQHKVVWNGTDDNGKSVSSGVYFYKMKSGDYQKTRKMILLK